MLQVLRVRTAPIFKSLRRMVPHWALANSVSLSPRRRRDSTRMYASEDRSKRNWFGHQLWQLVRSLNMSICCSLIRFSRWEWGQVDCGIADKSKKICDFLPVPSLPRDLRGTIEFLALLISQRNTGSAPMVLVLPSRVHPSDGSCSYNSVPVFNTSR